MVIMVIIVITTILIILLLVMLAIGIVTMRSLLVRRGGRTVASHNLNSQHIKSSVSNSVCKYIEICAKLNKTISRSQEMYACKSYVYIYIYIYTHIYIHTYSQMNIKPTVSVGEESP